MGAPDARRWPCSSIDHRLGPLRGWSGLLRLEAVHACSCAVRVYSMANALSIQSRFFARMPEVACAWRA
eukprot:6539072-Lingulodinium_polyedra.AAC.1